MNIIVTVKQVPDTHEVKINPKTGTFRCKECSFLMPAAVFQSNEYKKMNQKPLKTKSADSSSAKRRG